MTLRCFFLFLFSLFACDAIAQPTLPDISATADKGVVLLSWNCQYGGVKAISVLRSADSVANYASIGYVKTLGQGVQAYVDGHPAPGKNFYKLSIVFKTGLTWTSNHCSMYIDKSILESSKTLLPANDSLQRFIVTEDRNPCNPLNTPNAGTTSKPATGKSDAATVGNVTATQGNKKICISFGADTTQPDLTPHVDTAKKPVTHKAITIAFDDPSDYPATFIKSRFIFTNVLTGHVDMTLPDDVSLHHYSVKFFDQKNHLVIEVPKIKAAKTIIDKRNFQHKGLYKFVLRKDVTELETGYITIY